MLYISHSIQLTPQQLSAEPRSSAGDEALALARRPKEASREKYIFIFKPTVNTRNAKNQQAEPRLPQRTPAGASL